MSKITADQIIKNLVMDYPLDALEFIKPEIIERYGKPVKIDFNIQEIRKHSHFDRSMKNDIAVTYTFADDKRVILVLIEHWSDKSKFDIYRFAHYVIDLARKFPVAEILPVALFTDKSKGWNKKPAHEVRVHCLDEVYLNFKYRLIRMKDHEAEQYIETKNRFISVLRGAMNYNLEYKIILAVELITSYSYIENDINLFEKNMDAMEFFLEIKPEDRERITDIIEVEEDTKMISQELKKRGYNKGIQEGRQEGIKEGIKEGKLQTASGMLKENIPVETISRITGLTPEEINSLKKKK